MLFGTGKPAQLNGYSSGGKTGTAQKIDPATHTYSKTMHIASFAGFAPVNNPVIAVAVIIDSPKGAYYGADVSAPVFAEVAQQVLEYLGVPHDIDLRPAETASKKTAAHHGRRQRRPDDSDIQALYRPPTICPATIRCARAAAGPGSSAPASDQANDGKSEPGNKQRRELRDEGTKEPGTSKPPAPVTKPAPTRSHAGGGGH